MIIMNTSAIPSTNPSFNQNFMAVILCFRYQMHLQQNKKSATILLISLVSFNIEL